MNTNTERNQDDIAADEGQVRQLPLWKDFLRHMEETCITFGSSYTREEMEQGLGCKSDTMRFVGELINLRRELECKHGYYLAQVNNGSKFIVLDAADHEGISDTWQRKMVRFSKRSVIVLGHLLANPAAALAAEDRARIDRKQEIAAFKAALLAKSAKLKKHFDADGNGKLLE